MIILNQAIFHFLQALHNAKNLKLATRHAIVEITKPQ